MNLHRHTGRAKSCMRDRRYLPAIFKAVGDFLRETQHNSSEGRQEARNPDSDVEARQDFWSIVGDYIHLNHVAPRTKLCVPKDGFPIPLNYMNVQRHKKKDH